MKIVCVFANDLDDWGGGLYSYRSGRGEWGPVYPLKGVPLEKLDAYQKEIYAKCKLIRPAYTPIVGVETIKINILLFSGARVVKRTPIPIRKP